MVRKEYGAGEISKTPGHQVTSTVPPKTGDQGYPGYPVLGAIKCIKDIKRYLIIALSLDTLVPLDIPNRLDILGHLDTPLQLRGVIGDFA